MFKLFKSELIFAALAIALGSGLISGKGFAAVPEQASAQLEQQQVGFAR